MLPEWRPPRQHPSLAQPPRLLLGTFLPSVVLTMPQHHSAHSAVGPPGERAQVPRTPPCSEGGNLVSGACV